MSQISIKLNGIEQSIESGLDGFKLFTDKSVIALRVNGESRDLAYRPIDGDIVEGILRTLDHPATPNPAWTGEQPDPGTSSAPAREYACGRGPPSRGHRAAGTAIRSRSGYG